LRSFAVFSPVPVMALFKRALKEISGAAEALMDFPK
jgi:hypothetical protein